MLKKIWQLFVRWFRKLFGRGTSKSSLSGRGYANDRLVATAELPPLDDTDREYLFMQLLEGVAHGWQQPRAIGFFNKIRQRVRKSDWLEWLEKFGNNLLDAPVTNYELAGRMVQLGQLDCGEIGDLAGEYGARLLDRQAEQLPGGLLPMMEFEALEFDGVDAETPFDLSYSLPTDGSHQFGEVPSGLLLDNAPLLSPPFAPQPEAEDNAAETHEITLEEFSAMLSKDPGLVAELAEQFGIETIDPQVIVNAVVAQMQQQVQQVSGDLNPSSELTPSPTPSEIPSAPPEISPTPEVPPMPSTPPEVPSTPPEIPSTPPEISPIPATPPEIPSTPPEISPIPATPPEIPSTPPEISPIPSTPPEIPSTPPEMPPSTPAIPIMSANGQQIAPPPPPVPKLEYKPEDPWSSNLGSNDQMPETANTPDRRGV